MSEVTDGSGRYKHWNIKDFVGGYIDGVEDNLIPANASKNCNGVISVTIGSLESRKGQLFINTTDFGNFIQGLYSYYFSTGRRLMVACDGKIGYWNFTGTPPAFVSLVTGWSKTVPVMFETCVNYLVIFNGVDAPKKWDGTSVTALANAPAQGKYPVLHKEKVFCANTDHPSTILWSNSFEPETWPGVNYWDVKKGDGDEITCLFKYIGELIIFKRRSTHTLKGTSLDDFTLQELDSRVGAVGPRAVAQKDMYLYVVGEEGLYVFNGMKYTNLTNILIPKMWARVNQEYLHKAAVGIWDDKIWFSLPIDGSSVNNIVLVFVPGEGAQGTWWPWSGMNISCFTSFSQGDELLPYTGHSQLGRILQQDIGESDYYLTDDPLYLPKKHVGAYWESKYFDFGAAETEKKAKRAFVEASQETDAVQPSLIISKDYEDYESLVLERADSMVRQFRFINRDRWRYMSAKVKEFGVGGEGEITWTLDGHLMGNDQITELTFTRDSVAYDSEGVEHAETVYETVHDNELSYGFNLRGLLVPFKPKAKPKVRQGMGGMGI